MQAWLATSSPRAETTVGRTSFHDSIWMARMARQTQSWTRTGLGPAAYFLRSTSSWLRRTGRSLSDTCVSRSYVILAGQHRLSVVARGRREQEGTSGRHAYLALEGGGGEELGLCRSALGLEQCYRDGPCVVLRARVLGQCLADATGLLEGMEGGQCATRRDRGGDTDRLLEPAQEIHGLLLLARISALHGQHGGQDVGGRHDLNTIGSHDG